MPIIEKLTPTDIAFLQAHGIAVTREPSPRADLGKVLNEVLTMYAADAETAVCEMRNLRVQVRTWRDRWTWTFGAMCVLFIAATGELFIIIGQLTKQ